MRQILSIPALAIVVVAYLVMAAGGGMMIDADAYSTTFMSGAEMTLRGGDFFIIAGLVALVIDALKRPRQGGPSALQHILAIATFIVAANALVLFDYAGTSTFFMLTVMTLLVVLAGAYATLRKGQ